MNDAMSMVLAKKADAEMAKLAERLETKRAARERLRALRERAWLQMNPDRMPGQ